jgi:hypothetical protein
MIGGMDTPTSGPAAAGISQRRGTGAPGARWLRVGLLLGLVACAAGSQPAPQAGGAAPPAATGFQPTDPAFGAWLGALPALTLPIELPPPKVTLDAARAARVDRPERVCEPRYFDCNKLGPNPTLFVLGRVPISDDATGALVHGEGPKGSATALVTWNEAGQLVGGQVFGADYGHEWGFRGQLSADLKAERNRWVGKAEEFADHQTFRVRPDGSVELTVE